MFFRPLPLTKDPMPFHEAPWVTIKQSDPGHAAFGRPFFSQDRSMTTIAYNHCPGMEPWSEPRFTRKPLNATNWSFLEAACLRGEGSWRGSVQHSGLPSGPIPIPTSGLVGYDPTHRARAPASSVSKHAEGFGSVPGSGRDLPLF